MADYCTPLENLVLWVNNYCNDKCAQPFGIHKIPSDGGTGKYVAFVLVSELPEGPERYCVYNLLGFVNVPEGEPVLIYKAILRQHLIGKEFEKIRNTLFVLEHRVEIEEMKGKGIGSVAVDAIKSLAAIFHQII